MLTRIFLVFFICCFTAQVLAQVRLTVQVDERQLSTRDYLHIQYTIENAKKVTRFIPPSFNGFNVLQGPDYTNGWTLVNGEMKEYMAIGFVLQARGNGRFTIPQAEATADGKMLRSEAVDIVVSDQSAKKPVLPPVSGGDQPLDDFILKKGESIKEKVRKNMFVKLDVSRRSVFVGEPVEAVYKLYTRLNSESKVAKRPSFAGFSVFDMAEPESDQTTTEMVNGREYSVYLLRHVQLYPLQSGSFELESLQVDNTVSFIRNDIALDENTLNGILRALGDQQLHPDAWVKESVSLENAPVIITVKPLPESGQPAGFSGAVGRFNMQSRLIENDALYVGESATLELTLEGRGNLPVIGAPELVWGPEWESFEPEITEQISRDYIPLSGKKTYRIKVAPQRDGRLFLPAAQMSFFDPDSGKYRILKTDSIPVQVLPARTGQMQTEASAKNAIAEKEKNGLGWRISPWISLMALILTVLSGIWWLVSRKKKGPPAETSQPLDSYDQQVQDEVTQLRMFPVVYTLEKAGKFAEQGDATSFYKELDTVLRSVLRERFGLNGWEGRDRISKALQRAWVDEKEVDETLRMMDHCQRSLYAQLVVPDAMQEDLTKARWILDALQKPAGG